MEFKITGRILEKESGLGVASLQVRAYDKDMIYDDLLGTAITDGEGRFELEYTERDFQELFEQQPDIYLEVYAPPRRLLADTKEAIRWEADHDERIELMIDRQTLGSMAPSLPDDQVAAGISLSRADLIIEKRDIFDIPRLPGFASSGPPGAPALPQQVQFIALPL